MMMMMSGQQRREMRINPRRWMISRGLKLFKRRVNDGGIGRINNGKANVLRRGFKGKFQEIYKSKSRNRTPKKEKS
jgi:hypothetical protein